MVRGLRAAFLVLLLASGLPGTAGASGWLTGRNIIVASPADDGVVAVGRTIQVDAPVAGSVVLLGSTATVSGTVADSLFVLAGSTTLTGQVAGDVVLVAGSIDMEKTSVVSGDATLLGGDVTLSGTVAGDVAVKGGNLTLAGTVMGDVDASSGKLALLPGARIMGNVTFSGPHALDVPAGAHIEGKVEHKGESMHRSSHDDDEDEDSAQDRHDRRDNHHGWHIWMPWFGGIGLISFAVGMLLVGGVLYVLFPGVVTNVAAGIAAQPGSAAVKGLAVLILVPLVALLCLVTIIGIPVSLVLGFAYVLLLMVAMPLAGFALSDLMTQRRGPPVSPGDRIRRYALTVLVLSVVQAIPLAGGLVKFGLLLLGLGGATTHLRRRGPAAGY
ncbi:MAG: polymer-forming cytoskeletal protein [Azospirillaceae bacterium]|nr:polymer-forming cytoskeletal protein [Azospirillaceae bacterium]